MTAAWVPCPHCEDFWCTIHAQHAFECPCPPIEEWTTDPYSVGPSTPEDAETAIADPGTAIAHPVCSLVVDVPGGHRPIPLDRAARDAVSEALAQQGLWIGFYNKSGRTPSAMELRPSWDWPEEDRAAMGHPPRDRKLLTGVDIDRPHPVVERVGLGRLQRGRGGTHRARVPIIATSFVTHFSIGTRGGGVLAAGEFLTPMKVAAGGSLTFGLRLSDLGVAAPARTLNPLTTKALPRHDEDDQ